MVIEWLRYQVPQELHETFLKADAAIWTTTLLQQAGFIGKQIWFNPEIPNELNLVIQWQTKEDWKAIPEVRLLETHEAFVREVGQIFTLLEVLEYEIME
jgi:uncharacterized protein (TIGR03792 family)